MDQYLKLMDPMMKIDARDRNELLKADVDRLLGMIMKLNHRPKYHNTLDAIKLTSSLIEMKQKLSRKKSTAPSAGSPVPSERMR